MLLGYVIGQDNEIANFSDHQLVRPIKKSGDRTETVVQNVCQFPIFYAEVERQNSYVSVPIVEDVHFCTNSMLLTKRLCCNLSCTHRAKLNIIEPVRNSVRIFIFIFYSCNNRLYRYLLSRYSKCVVYPGSRGLVQHVSRAWSY